MEQADRDGIALDTVLCSIVRAATRGSRALRPWLTSPDGRACWRRAPRRSPVPRPRCGRRSLARSSTTVSRNPPAFAVAENNPSPNRLRPRQIGRVEARAEQNLGSADALTGSHDVQREGPDTIVVRVCQITFRLGPDELVRIEFGRVAGEAMDLHAGIPLEKCLDIAMSMD